MRKKTPHSLTRIIFVISSILLLSGCAALSAKSDYNEQTTGMDFIFVKGGTFQMGSINRPNEQPIHTVSVPDLFVGMYEVTFAQYDQYCTTNRDCEPPSDNDWGRGNRPVINVSWHDANAYAAWLSQQTGLQFRLPTEAEWEYFTRAGTTTAYWNGDTLPKGTANCSDCGSKWSNKMTAPTGKFAHNPWKIYNTAGNVTEWVADDYKNNYIDAPIDGSAVIFKESKRKVQRGGAWDYSIRDSRSAARDYRNTSDTYSNAGFRLVLTPAAAIPLPTNK